MRKKQIAIVISSLLATGLVGCNSATDNAAAPTAPAAAQSETKSSANVTFSAAFPATGSAQAAVIDENATSILIQVYATEVSNWGDYFSQQNSYGGYYDGYSEETLVSEFYLDTTSPSQSVSLIPGPYRIIASQFDDAGLENGSPISEAVTLGELVSGDNSVVLNMLHGTWTFKDADNVDAPLELLLLNRTDLVDIDPDTEGQQPLDWDPSTPDTVESAAAAMGLTEAPIKGLHLIGTPSGLLDGYGGYYPQIANISPGEALSRFGYSALIRQDNGLGGETIAYPTTSYDGLCDELAERCTDMESNPGIVLHEFDGATNTNTAHVDFGSMSISFSPYGGGYNTGTGDRFDAGLFTAARYEAQELGYVGYSDSEWPGEPVDDGTNYVYTPTSEEGVSQWSSSYYNPETGADETIYLADLSSSEEIWSQTNEESPLFDLASETVATDGSTIVGSIIEYMVVGISAENGFSGTDAPIYSGPTPASSGNQQRNKRIAAIKKAIALDNIAIAAGLKARSANINGSNCRTLSTSNNNLSASYAWDEETSQWVAGEYNYSYYWDGETILGDDLNGDGVVDIFETDVVDNWTYSEVWDPATSSYIPTGDDLDGDGTVEQYENVGAMQESRSAVVEVCIHPFTLKGGQLSYVADTTVEVASE